MRKRGGGKGDLEKKKGQESQDPNAQKEKEKDEQSPREVSPSGARRENLNQEKR